MTKYRCVVYRVYDANDRLIYVGATNCLSLRMKQHELASWWHELIARVDFADYPDYDQTLAAEAVAIQEEAPVFNVMHREAAWRDRDFADWTENDIRICREWMQTYPARLRYVPTTVKTFIGAAGSAVAA